MSPAAQGGSLCESTALRAVEALQAMGGTCVKDVVKFDEMADVFYIDIEVEFFGTALETGWSSGPGYAVTIGAQPMPHAVSFQAEQKTDEEFTTLSKAPWQFAVEELLPPGTSEPTNPAEPFTLTVTRSKTDEVFSGCTWISVKREDTIRGVSQIRVGRAESRAVLSVL